MKPYYQDECCTIYHGDCREVLPTLGPVDLVLTDPPYGIGADSSAHRASGNIVGHGHRRVAKRVYDATNWDSEPPSAQTIGALIGMGRFAILWGGNYFSLTPSGKWLAWDKLNDGNKFADCELAWTNLPGSTRIKRHLWNGMARERSEIRYDHPTQKPLDLMRWCITQAPADCELILDPFMGSGTTLVAAKQLGRRAIGIEIRREYCDIAVKRLAQAVLDLRPVEPEPEQQTLLEMP